jgi:DNA (cytosine-5)-methyltransferase 1
MTSRVWAVHENQQAELRLYENKTWPLHTGGGKPGQGYPLVMTDEKPTMILRRLTPLECERLMGWPDGWTEHGVTDDGTTVDIAITQRYRICGNGIVSNVTQWLGERLNDITGGVNNG